MFKIMTKKFFALIFVLIILIPSTLILATAHTLTPWSNYYPASSANSTYSFGLTNYYHINGNNIKYYWDNSSIKFFFNQAVTEAFSVSWKNIISGTEVTNLNSAHVTLKYDPINHPNGYAAETICFVNDGHYYLGNSSIQIIFYDYASNSSEENKRKIAAHEIGHLWGIADLYPYNDSLNSIYSNIYNFNTATRHDFNAMRIALNDLWFNPGENLVWKYQPTPGTFILRGDIDQDGQITASDSRLALQGSSALTSLQIKLADVDGDEQITSSDSRLILRYAVALDHIFPADIYEG